MQSRQTKTHNPEPAKAAEPTQKAASNPVASKSVPAWTNAWGDQPPLAIFPKAAGNVPHLQAKLTISQPDDPYEQEADRMAERVVSTPEPVPQVQRKCACGGIAGPTGECEACVAKRRGLQRRATGQIAESTVPPVVNQVLSSGNSRPLDPATRTFMEPRFGYDFSQVRVHSDAKAAESAQAVNALAYTVGSDVVFGHGQYKPGTNEGQKLLAHELTHVVQQAHSFSLQRQTTSSSTPASQSTPSASSSAPASQSAPAGHEDPPSLLTLQIPLSLVNFQFPVQGSANVFVLPPKGERNANFDQAWQPNIAVGLNASLHRSPRGFEIGLFAQGGPNFSLNLPSLPTTSQGKRTFFTGGNLQGYLQPAYVFFKSKSEKHQFSLLLQPGVGKTWSSVPGIQGTTVTVQGGLQYTWEPIKDHLQVTGAVLFGYNWTELDQPPPGMSSLQQGSFIGISIALQPVVPLLNWPSHPKRGSRPSPAPEHRSEESEPKQPEPKQPEPKQPEPEKSTTESPSDVPPEQSSPIPASSVSEIFFHVGRPRVGETGQGALKSCLTSTGYSNLMSLVQQLQANPSLNVELVGMASSEGGDEYNLRLAKRRLDMVSDALGMIDPARITAPAQRDVKDECEEVKPGIYNCGAKLADKHANAKDRKVMALIFIAPQPAKSSSTPSQTGQTGAPTPLHTPAPSQPSPPAQSPVIAAPTPKPTDIKTIRELEKDQHIFGSTNFTSRGVFHFKQLDPETVETPSGKQYRPKIQPVRTLPPQIESYYARIGKQELPGEDRSGNCGVFLDVDEYLSRLIMQGEKQHVDDIMWAYEHTLKKVADLINELASSQLPLQQSPPAAKEYAERIFLSRLSQISPQLVPENLTESAQEKAWRDTFIQLAHATGERDKRGWHDIQTREDRQDGCQKVKVYDDGHPNIDIINAHPTEDFMKGKLANLKK